MTNVGSRPERERNLRMFTVVTSSGQLLSILSFYVVCSVFLRLEVDGRFKENVFQTYIPFPWRTFDEHGQMANAFRVCYAMLSFLENVSFLKFEKKKIWKTRNETEKLIFVIEIFTHFEDTWEWWNIILHSAGFSFLSNFFFPAKVWQGERERKKRFDELTALQSRIHRSQAFEPSVLFFNAFSRVSTFNECVKLWY